MLLLRLHGWILFFFCLGKKGKVDGKKYTRQTVQKVVKLEVNALYMNVHRKTTAFFRYLKASISHSPQNKITELTQEYMRVTP